MKPTGSGIEEPSHRGFWNLWNVQHEKLMRYCVNLMGGSEEDGKDAMGGTLLKALDAWTLNQGRLDNPTGWLFKIAHNHCMDQHRDAGRRLRSDGDPDELAVRNRDLHPDLPESPEETFLRREMHVNLEEAIDQLSPLLRDVMILRCVRELSYSAIADELSISEETVRKRVQLGREAIRNHLENYDKGSAGAMPIDVLLPDEGEKALSESVAIDPYKDLKLRRDHGRMVTHRNKKGEEWETLAYSSLSTRRLSQKIAAAEKYIQKFPTGWVKRMDLAELYYLSGHWSSALEQADQVINKGSRQLGTVLLKTALLIQSGERRNALRTLKKALSLTSKPGIQSFMEGLMALISRQHPIAVRALGKACKIAPDQSSLPVFLCKAFLQQGDPLRAKNLLKTLPKQESAMAAQALRYQLYIQLSAPIKAQRVLDQLLIQFPNDLPALERKTIFRMEQGWVFGDAGKETRALIRRMGKIAPKSAVPVAFKAEYQFLRGKPQKAIELLRNFLNSHPDSLMGRYHLARMHSLLGQRKEALLELSTTPTLQSGQYLQPSLLDLFLNQGVNPITAAMDTHADWEVKSLQAWFDIFQPATQARGVAAGERLLEFRSGWPVAWYRKGWLDLLAGRSTEAVSTWSQAWEILPEEGGFCIRAGICLGRWLASTVSSDGKGQIHWEAQLKHWLPFAATENLEFHNQLSTFFRTHRTRKSVQSFPLLFFGTQQPGLWVHDWPLL